MGKKKKKNAGKSGGGKNNNNKENGQENSGSAEMSSSDTKPVIKKVAKKPEEPPKGINMIPYWLRHEKGLSDFVAGGIVLIGAGLLIVIICSILILAWPAR